MKQIFAVLKFIIFIGLFHVVTGGPIKASVCSPWGVYFRPSDKPHQCHKFILCVNGQRVDQVCGHNLLFDLDTLTCVDWRRANCDIDTCARTWNGDDFIAAYAPNLKNCQQYFICTFGVAVKTQICPTGQSYTIDRDTELNGVRFMGRCVTGSVQCFNGQNWDPPAFPDRPETTTEPEPEYTTTGWPDEPTTYDPWNTDW